MSVDWDRFCQIVQEHQRFLLTSHVRPDCDALGSELGMRGILETLGKEVRIVNAQATPANLRFIDPEQRIQALGEEVTADQLRDIDVLMVLDTSAWVQLGSMADVVRESTAKRVVLDHHVSEDDLGAELFKDTSAEAAGRLVIDAADALGVPLTKPIANPLFAAITTDTGWFRFPSATAQTYRCAARLIEAGASPPDLYSNLYEQDTLGRIRLRGTALARVQTELAGRVVHTYVLKEDYQATGAVPTDTEDIINLTLGIAGTEGAVIFIEQPAGGFKVSFRSRGPMDCSAVAQKFGGGGHKAAAGVSLTGTLDEIREKILPEVLTAMQAS